MSDIVERLRKGIEWTGPTQDDTGQTENLMDEAADEITRLRVEVETLRAARDLALEEAARVVVENYQELCAEHRLLLLNRANAIRALKSGGATPSQSDG